MKYDAIGFNYAYEILENYTHFSKTNKALVVYRLP